MGEDKPILPSARLSRRGLLSSAGALGVAVLAGCKKEPIACKEVELPEGDRKVRRQLGYVDQGTEADKLCRNCVQFISGTSPDGCGSCKLMQGPIHPLGSCAVFAPMS